MVLTLTCVQLLDLCVMDIGALGFSYSVLAAAAFCHFSSFDVVHRVSGSCHHGSGGFYIL